VPMTENYIRDRLLSIPTMPLGNNDGQNSIVMEELYQQVERFFARSFVAPKSNIGTLHFEWMRHGGECRGGGGWEDRPFRDHGPHAGH
jgi:hypothetical protein